MSERPKCAYCHWPIESDEELKRCPSCGAAHHKDCWAEGGGCAVYGCRSSRAARMRRGAISAGAILAAIAAVIAAPVLAFLLFRLLIAFAGAAFILYAAGRVLSSLTGRGREEG